jgi:hypothetical protein
MKDMKEMIAINTNSKDFNPENLQRAKNNSLNFKINFDGKSILNMNSQGQSEVKKISHQPPNEAPEIPASGQLRQRSH